MSPFFVMIASLLALLALTKLLIMTFRRARRSPVGDADRAATHRPTPEGEP